MSLEISEKAGVRYLHFGSELVQGAMRIARPWALELEYTRELMFPLLLRPESWPRAVLQVGLGAASTAKFLFRHRPRARITVVELDADVPAAARAFFRMPDDPRLRIEIGEGHEFISSTRSQFDLLVVDGFDAEGRPGMLDQAPFYHACRQRLRERGLVAINLIDRGRNLAPCQERLRAAFDGQVRVLPRNPGGNTIVIAGEGVLSASIDAMHVAAEKLKAATGLDLAPTVARMS